MSKFTHTASILILFGALAGACGPLGLGQPSLRKLILEPSILLAQPGQAVEIKVNSNVEPVRLTLSDLASSGSMLGDKPKFLTTSPGAVLVTATSDAVEARALIAVVSTELHSTSLSLPEGYSLLPRNAAIEKHTVVNSEEELYSLLMGDFVAVTDGRPSPTIPLPSVDFSSHSAVVLKMSLRSYEKPPVVTHISPSPQAVVHITVPGVDNAGEIRPAASFAGVHLLLTPKLGDASEIRVYRL